MHCSRAIGEFIVCYLALISSHLYALQPIIGEFIVCYLPFILSHLYALQPSHWRVHFMLFTLHFESFVCIAAEHLEWLLYVIKPSF